MSSRLMFALAISLALFATAYAQQDVPSASSALSDTSRFQVVQSPLLAKLTFRLDRYSGDTWQFVQAKGSGFVWQKMERLDAAGDTRVPGKPNYFVFLSGIRAQITVLMNTNTGTSWYIVEDPSTGPFWKPVSE